MRFSSIILVVILGAGFIFGFISGSLITAPTTIVTISDVGNGTETLRSYIILEKTVTVIKPTNIISLNEKAIINMVNLTITKTFYKTDRSINASCIVFKTDKDVYKISEPVILVLENNCDFVLLLPNSAPWKIFDSGLKEVFTPITLQVISEVRPGNIRIWLWDQKNYNGMEVSPGIYYIVLETIDIGAVKTRMQIIH
ncbi:MAG: hypothetical protein QXM29_06185 [Nitrososphaerales archaeon]|uniref:hypothetical protein n=1 Tax=Saccharolobus sp. TaxID=2100761 RepID=UPI003170FBA0